MLPSTRQPGRWILCVGMAVYAITFVLLYPRTFAIVDEDAYLTQALLFRNGRLSYETSSIPAPHMTVEHEGRLQSKYPPGNGLFLLPFTLLGWRAAFFAGLLLALAGTWLFMLVLREIEPRADPAWALLYLCYPAVTLYSRTLMSDLLSTTAVLAAFWLILRGRHLGAGIALGFACLVRYSNAVLVPVFAVVLLLLAGRKLRATGLLLAGVLPFGLLAAGYNWYSYGGPLSFPFYLTGHFAAAYFPRNFPVYTLNLSLVYPLMLVAPFALRGRWVWPVALPALALLMLYSFFSYVHDVPSIAERIAVGMRYLLPAVPFFVLGFVAILHRADARFRWFRVLKYAGIAAMLFLGIVIQFRHDHYLAAQQRGQRALLEAVPEHSLLLCNKDASELLSPSWGTRNWRHFVEFNVPLPLAATIGRAETAYAALRYRPGRTSIVEYAVFQTLLARYPGRETVLEMEDGEVLKVVRLRPGRSRNSP